MDLGDYYSKPEWRWKDAVAATFSLSISGYDPAPHHIRVGPGVRLGLIAPRILEFSGRREPGDFLANATLHWQVFDGSRLMERGSIKVRIVELKENNPPTEIYDGGGTSGSAKVHLSAITLSAKFRLTAERVGCQDTSCRDQKEIKVSAF